MFGELFWPALLLLAFGFSLLGSHWKDRLFLFLGGLLFVMLGVGFLTSSPVVQPSFDLQQINIGPGDFETLVYSTNISCIGDVLRHNTSLNINGSLKSVVEDTSCYNGCNNITLECNQLKIASYLEPGYGVLFILIGIYILYVSILEKEKRGPQY